MLDYLINDIIDGFFSQHRYECVVRFLADKDMEVIAITQRNHQRPSYFPVLWRVIGPRWTVCRVEFKYHDLTTNQ